MSSIFLSVDSVLSFDLARPYCSIYFRSVHLKMSKDISYKQLDPKQQKFYDKHGTKMV